MEREPEPFDIVLTDENDLVLGLVRSIYVKPRQHMNDKIRRTVVEIVCGWSAVRNRFDGPTKMRPITEENWERAIGLVVCGLAERIQL